MPAAPTLVASNTISATPVHSITMSGSGQASANFPVW